MHVHLDIIGPLPSANNFQYCLTAVDRFSRWPEVYPLERITAEDVADVFIRGWISRFGCPERITTDQGRQFESKLFHALSAFIGAHRSRSSPYHPQANGMVERLHRQLKAALMCHPGSSWYDALPLILLGIRSAFKEDIQASSAEILYGEPLRLPGEFVQPDPGFEHPLDITLFVDRLRQITARLRPVPASRHATPGTFIFKELATCTHVFLRDDTVRGSLRPPYTGPFRVLSRDSKNFTLRIKNNNVIVSIDRIKPAFVLADDLPAPVDPGGDAVSQQRSPTLSPPDKPPAVTTRYGRRVHFPDRYCP
jgi:hypothetical protein